MNSWAESIVRELAAEVNESGIDAFRSRAISNLRLKTIVKVCYCCLADRGFQLWGHPRV